MPGGLSWDELSAILRMSVETGRALGVNITIFNPRLDLDGSITNKFTEALVAGLNP